MINNFARPTVVKLILFLIVPCLLVSFSISCGKNDKTDTKPAASEDTSIGSNHGVSINGDVYSVVEPDLLTPQTKSKVTLEEYKQLSEDNSPTVDENQESEVCDFTVYNKTALDLQGKALGSGNHVLCAASLFHVVGMLQGGAAGQTSEKLIEQLPFLDDPCDPVSKGALSNPDVSVSHFMWGQENYLFSKNFLQTLDTRFDPEFNELDFVNDREGAKNEIDSAFGEDWGLYNVTDRTRMVLGVDMTMELDTSSLFKTPETFDGLFEGFDGKQYRKPHIRIQGEYGCYRSDDLNAIDVSSETSSLSMLFIFPSDETAFNSLSENLEFSVSTILASLKTETVSFAVPEFTIESWYDPSYFLDLDETTQDFSGVNDLGYLLLNDQFVNSSINLNFESLTASGTAGATIDATPDEPESVWAGYTPYSANDVYIVIEADTLNYIDIEAGVPDSTPFLFIIRDKSTGAILVSGALLYSGGEEA